MKKSKLSLGLVTSFIAAMALSACGSDVTKNSSNLVDFTGYEGQSLSVSIDEIYKDYLESSAGISKYYDQVMEVLIRHAFQKDKAGNGVLKGVKRNYNQILDKAKEDVETAKETAKQNAESNGTDRKTEWQNILSEKGVKDEEELLQYYIYKLEKEEIEDWYFENHKDSLRREFLGVWSSSAEGSEAPGTPVASVATSRFPYHIRHILIKNEEGANDYVRGTISKDAAKRLSSTVQLLADGRTDDNRNGNTFGEVAFEKSEDSSNTSYGDVGIMTNEISGEKLKMVNEFQLGIYAYDAIVKNGAGARSGDAYTVIDRGLGLNKDVTVGAGTKAVSQALVDRGIMEIPYSVFVELGDVAELEANYLTGLTVEDNKTALYPRNLLWNRYLNNHNIFVITNGAREGEYDPKSTAIPQETRDVKAVSTYYGDGVDAYEKYDGTGTAINYAKLGGFKANDNFKNKPEEKVLTDERGNVIIGVRSEFGIHLMIVEKSAYDFNSGVKLEDYYTVYTPNDTGKYPTNIPEGDHTYVDFIINLDNQNEYKTRADTVKTAIKGFDSTYDYRLYEELRSLDGVDTGANEPLFTAINDYIGLQREKNRNEQQDGLKKVWQTYLDLLATQDYYRKDIRDTSSAATYNDRVVPEGCKIAFTKDARTFTEEQQKQFKKAFEEGGYCYVK